MFRIFILLIASLFSSARGINYGRFETVPLASDASVANCFAQDSLGLIWIGTNRGLYSYDGYSVRSHSSASDPSCSQIYCILRRDNTFYLGSDNGLFAYDCTGDYYSPRMEISSKAGTDGPGISTMPKNVRALAMCDNRLWIGSLNGLYRYDFDTGRLDTLTRGLPHKTIYSLLVTSGGDIYVGTYNGLCRYLPSTDSFERIRIPSDAGKNNTFVNSLLEDVERGCIWIGTEGNLYKYTLSDGSVSAVGMVADNSVKSLALDIYGNLIIGTDNCLYIYNGRDGKHFVHDSRNHETVSNDIVWSVFVDNEHNLWLGTEYNISLARNDRDKRTVPIAELTGKGEGNRFYSILKDSHGYLWLGGTNGLVRYDARRGKSVSYKMSDKKNPVPHNRIRDIYEDSEKGLWVATDGSIIKYDYARSRFDKYLITDSSRTMNANWSYSIFEDKSGKLWIGAYLGGVFVVDRKALLSSGGTPCMAERNFSSSNGLPGNLINQMVQGKNGNAWVLIYKGGLYRINELSGKVDREDIEKATGESPDYIISDDNGNIWCGFAGGIAMRSDDGTKWSVARFGEFDKSGVLSMEQ
ncbi:MAG: hybrid sensor histidine kinase/response regulator, partial [Bacteroidales bacterium]|nr:hybrid sensor histidine kinase/response regulator [Bacteroidales bacterium]